MASGNNGATTPAPTSPAPPATYSGDPGSSIRDQVRFLLGDTGPTGWLLSDGEIDFLVASNSGNAYRAAMQACYSLVAKFSRRADETVGQISVRWSTLKDNFAALADSLQAQQNKFGGDFRAYMGGKSRAEREAVESNPDRMGGQFRRGHSGRRFNPYGVRYDDGYLDPGYDRIP